MANLLFAGIPELKYKISFNDKMIFLKTLPLCLLLAIVLTPAMVFDLKLYLIILSFLSISLTFLFRILRFNTFILPGILIIIINIIAIICFLSTNNHDLTFLKNNVTFLGLNLLLPFAIPFLIDLIMDYIGTNTIGGYSPRVGIFNSNNYQAPLQIRRNGEIVRVPSPLFKRKGGVAVIATPIRKGELLCEVCFSPLVDDIFRGCTCETKLHNQCMRVVLKNKCLCGKEI